MAHYKTIGKLDLPSIDLEILAYWQKHDVFKHSIDDKPKDKTFVFYEGPPSANGKPGIHHVMARTVKDLFCRFQTMKGHRVNRKGGWDTHGLPIELSVEKELGITKEDIGTKISIDDYNAKCRETVMRYKDMWDDITRKMGYWVDLDHPYVTFEDNYIESVWWLLKQLYNKDLLYKGYTIQPYSPAAGTGLSSHELNQPGTYQDVTDTTVTAQFETIHSSLPQELQGMGTIYILAWTTTPWTLPSNTALTVGPKIDYVVVRTYNQYTYEPIQVIMAEALVAKQMAGKYKAVDDAAELTAYQQGDKKIPYQVIHKIKGRDLVDIRYHQLLPLALPYRDAQDAFRVIAGDFVTTADGTGVVHTAPTFGADDAMVAKLATPPVPPMLVLDDQDNPAPLVDLQGRFRAELPDVGGKYVKNEYYHDADRPERSVDVELAIRLKEENKAFKVEKYVHSYPHCWRTDKPVLYYPLDSWFVRSTAAKDRMIELNKTINWKPAHTGEKRFGNWLENLQDWNLSRSRYWGIPLPIWRSEDGTEEVCIGSIEELNKAIATANKVLGLDQKPPKELHRPYIDDVVLVSPEGSRLVRELDLIDVWFDSGSMPYAQWHYPFENKETFEANFPADFIAEGVDQTRGWFFTLHAIATMVFDSVAYKNVVSNGLVQDKKGQKMSKRLGNAVEPFETIDTYGADATRWYLISNAQPWDNLKFDEDGIGETQRKFFGTLYNTYAFFSLYANLDGFAYAEEEVAIADRPEIDQWVLSLLNSLVQLVDADYADYEPTNATRRIQGFVDEHLSNWYVRLCRRRFWKGDYTTDKISAYQTLYTCMSTITKLMAPVAPFFSDWLYQNLNAVSKREACISVHLADFPVADTTLINPELEQRMDYAQRISSLVLSLRKADSLRVRQPLQRILLPVLDPAFEGQVEAVKELILAEVNVKEIEYITDTAGIVDKKAKPNFKTLGRKLGKDMKAGKEAIEAMTQAQIADLEHNNAYDLVVGSNTYTLTLEDVEVLNEDIPGWQVASDRGLTVALDISLTPGLIAEGMARELVNRIQNIRKDNGYEVTDRIQVVIQELDSVRDAISGYSAYIATEVLADSVELGDAQGGHTVDLLDGEEIVIKVSRV